MKVDKWYRVDFQENITKNWKAAAEFLNADDTDILTQRNATSGLIYLLCI